MKKVDEELNELKEALDKKDKDCIEDELGDLFFTLINLSRHLKLDPEQTLRKSNDKFISNAPAAVILENRTRIEVGGKELLTLQAALKRVMEMF